MDRCVCGHRYGHSENCPVVKRRELGSDLRDYVMRVFEETRTKGDPS